MHVGHRVGRHVLRRKRGQRRREDLRHVDVHPLEQQRRRRTVLQHRRCARRSPSRRRAAPWRALRRRRGRWRSGGGTRRSRSSRRTSGSTSRAARGRARRPSSTSTAGAGGGRRVRPPAAIRRPSRSSQRGRRASLRAQSAAVSPALLCTVDVGAAVEQQADDRRVLMVRRDGEHQRGHAAAVFGVDVGAGVEQRFDQLRRRAGGGRRAAASPSVSATGPLFGDSTGNSVGACATAFDLRALRRAAAAPPRGSRYTPRRSAA